MSLTISKYNPIQLKILFHQWSFFNNNNKNNNNITIFIQVSLFSNVHLLLSIKDLFTKKN